MSPARAVARRRPNQKPFARRGRNLGPCTRWDAGEVSTPRVLEPDHPDALTVVAAMAAEFPAWRGAGGEGWGGGAPSAGLDAFVVLYDDEQPVAGAAIKDGGDGIAAVSRMCVVAERRGRRLGRELLDALEDTAREHGFEQLRLDSTCFLLRPELRYGPAGYKVGPPYAGDTDVPVWAEKDL